MKEHLDIILGIVALIAVVYRAFQIETKIYDTIEDLKESTSNRINTFERSLGLHIAIYSERKEQVDYLLHALDDKINHKSNRFFDEIKEFKNERKCKCELDEN